MLGRTRLQQVPQAVSDSRAAMAGVVEETARRGNETLGARQRGVEVK